MVEEPPDLSARIRHATDLIEKVEGFGQVRMHSRIGRPVAMHANWIGKVILAFSEQAVRAV